jgi:hypothetical protein
VAARPPAFDAMQYIAGRNASEVIDLVTQHGYVRKEHREGAHSSTLKFQSKRDRSCLGSLSVWNRCWLVIVNRRVHVMSEDAFRSEYQVL